MFKIEDNSPLADELRNLPDHYYDEFDEGFLLLLAALRLRGFTIMRADEAKATLRPNDDLWPELSHPSVWMYAAKSVQLANKLRDADPESKGYNTLQNEIIRANLLEQTRLLTLLQEFYAEHAPPSLYARLVVDTLGRGESYLRPQAASIRLVAEAKQQKQWYAEGKSELAAFGQFLAKPFATDR